MKETDFIKRNYEKWAKDEKLFDIPDADPDRVTEAFSEIIEDLSYARTFYPFRSVRVYLNRLARNIYFKLNVRRFSMKNLIRFWTDEIPKAMLESRRDMNLAFFIFLAGMLIGVVSTVYDPDFPRIVLGDSYVDMTIENIENGDPMKVYKEAGQFDMFLGITVNNLMVSYRVFVLGILFSVGSAVILFYNAIMVGTFQFFFFQNAVFLDSVLTIWLHGTLEISAIILAGGAGLTLGRGLLFPGTLSRRVAFQLSARRGLKIMLGITPVFILAAFIESFATRYTDAPDILRILIILGSLAFILGYYVWYPWKKSQVGFDDEKENYKLPPHEDFPIVIDDVKTTGELFSDTFMAAVKEGASVYRASAVAALVLTAVFLYLNRQNDLLPVISSDWFVFNLNRYFTFYKPGWPFLLNVILFTGIIGVTGYRFNKITSQPKLSLKRMLAIPVPVFLWQLIFLLPTDQVWWVLILLTPIVFLVLAALFDTKHQFNPSSLMELLLLRIHHTLFIMILLVFVSLIVFFVAYSPVMYFYTQVVIMNVDMTDSQNIFFVTGLISWLLTFVFFSITALIFTGIRLQYYNLYETKFAEGLMAKIEKIKTKKLAYGFERES